MAHKNKLSLIAQVNERIKSFDKRGQSKHSAKDEHGHVDDIYGNSTYDKYLRVCCRFVTWCKTNHKCKTLDDCRRYVDEWITKLIDAEYSASTIKQYACAVAKLYQCSTKEFIKPPSRLRANTTRSRGEKVRDAHFSEKNNKAIVEFCKSTGLRRHELKALRTDDLICESGTYYVHVRRGKGGKERYTKVIGDIQNVIDCFEKSKDDKYGRVFPKIPNGMDVHGYRIEYANTYYQMTTRNVKGLQKEETYIYRKDKCGIVYDRKAMLTVSRNLGHNRIDVIAQSYLD